MWVCVNVCAHRYVKWGVVGRVLAQPPALLSLLPASCYGGGEPTFWLQVWGCTVLLFCGMAWGWAAPLPAMWRGGGKPPSPVCCGVGNPPPCCVLWGLGALPPCCVLWGLGSPPSPLCGYVL